MDAETLTSPDAIDIERDRKAERCFQSVLQPLVDKAWHNHCRRFMIEPGHKIERESWYRDIIQTVVAKRSTRGCDPEERRSLIRHFNMLANVDGVTIQVVTINGWTDRQSEQYSILARKAFSRAKMRGDGGAQWDSWRQAQFLKATGVPETIFGVDKTHAFDKVMALLAQVANDEYWMRRTSQSDEVRMIYQIRRYMRDLEHLLGHSVDWNYVRGIWKQTRMLPGLDDAPADALAKVLGMLDTHIRRLCKKVGIRPMDLPTRGGPAAAPVTAPAGASEEAPF